MSADEYFVRYPPDPPDEPRTVDELRQAIVGTSDDDMAFGDRFALDMAMFCAGSDNPAQKAQALCKLHAERVYPPTEAMAWLADGFARWMDTDGETSLEVCLGLRRPEKKSAANRLAALKRDNRRSNLAEDVRRLRRVFGLSRTEAAGIVAASIADEPDPITETTLEQFEKALPPNPEFDDILDQITEEARIVLLSRFPSHTYRHLMRKSRILQRVAKKSGIE